ncbi:hypothetical protein LCGC14_2527010, partial [marine sediment metagenome]
MKTSDFTFNLPDDLIAQYPPKTRTASRLLSLERTSGKTEDLLFPNLLSLLNNDDLLVFNNTKVIPARLLGTKDSGGKVEVLVERVLDDNRVLAHVKSSKSPSARPQ